MVSIKELEKSIAIEKAKVRKAEEEQAARTKKADLQKELFALKNRGAIATAGKAGRLLRRGARGLKRALQKAAPVIRKQARLIRDQQLRDEAIVKRLRKRRQATEKVRTRIRKRIRRRPLRRRRTPSRIIRREERIEREPDDNGFGSLGDFGF